MSRKKPRKRIKIKGHYMQVRQRFTKKGTIMGINLPNDQTL